MATGADTVEETSPTKAEAVDTSLAAEAIPGMTRKAISRDRTKAMAADKVAVDATSYSTEQP